MFWIASTLRTYILRAMNWLVRVACAVDQVSLVLLEAAQRRYRRWVPVTRLTVTRKGRIIKFEVRKHGL